MKKSRQLIGMNVVDAVSGKICGRVKEIVYVLNKREILGFIVDCGRWMKAEKILMKESILNIGSEKIMARDINEIESIDKHKDLFEALEEKKKILSHEVISNTGEGIGYIDDIIIDEKTCNIRGYVLTDGIIEDIIKGKTVIPFNDEIIFGEDTIILGSDYKSIMLKNDIILKKVFKKIKRAGR
jgi:uncharacterized protein YrrD